MESCSDARRDGDAARPIGYRRAAGLCWRVYLKRPDAAACAHAGVLCPVRRD